MSLITTLATVAQQDPSLLSVERIFASRDFRAETFGPARGWTAATATPRWKNLPMTAQEWTSSNTIPNPANAVFWFLQNK
ncbi:MAG: hypothetical protein R3C26_23560 [Calditrichia bacterium]